MQALTQQLLLLHRSPSTSPTLVASSSPSCTSSSSSSLRGPSCWSNSFPSPLSWGSRASSSSSSSEQHAERLWWRCGPTGRLNLSSVRPRNVIRAATGDSSATSTIEQPSSTGKDGGGRVGQQQEDDRVKHITTIEQFDEALISAKKKLVVVEYAATHSSNSRKIYPSMVDLSKTLKGVVFLLVLGDESDDTRELCERAGVEKVPHFVFYKHSVKIHEEQGITEEMLEGDVLYYGDNDAPIHQVRNKDDFEVLLNEHASDNKLVVLDIGLKSCGPCAKIYPTFVKLATRMAGNTVFARMHGDENKECVTLLKSMDVKEVPTFLFLRDGKPLGRYVGSGRGELVGEILRHNGVRCT